MPASPRHVCVRVFSGDPTASECVFGSPRTTHDPPLLFPGLSLHSAHCVPVLRPGRPPCPNIFYAGRLTSDSSFHLPCGYFSWCLRRVPLFVFYFLRSQLVPSYQRDNLTRRVNRTNLEIIWCPMAPGAAASVRSSFQGSLPLSMTGNWQRAGCLRRIRSCERESGGRAKTS